MILGEQPSQRKGDVKPDDGRIRFAFGWLTLRTASRYSCRASESVARRLLWSQVMSSHQTWLKDRSSSIREGSPSGSKTNVEIQGTVAVGLEGVRQAFSDNFVLRGELGAACCVYKDGSKVVDLWGGLRDRASRLPWRENTMAIVHSATKGMSAMVMALANSRGWLDYDERVCCYWPGHGVLPRRRASRGAKHGGTFRRRRGYGSGDRQGIRSIRVRGK